MMNGKAATLLLSLSMNANLNTRQRFFQSGGESMWDEEVNVVDERVERAWEALKYQVRLQDLVEILDWGRIGEEDDEDDNDDNDEVVMSVDS